jgi:hypothetical protein
MNRYLKCFLLMGLGSIVLGCAQVAPMMGNTLPISTLEQQQAGEMAVLQGSVKQVAPFLQGGAYLLADDSGEIWIVAMTALPEVGQRLTVEGEVVYESVAIEGREWGEVYLRERQRW